MRDCLIQQPAIFDQAYSKLFTQELQNLKRQGVLGDLPDAWAIRKFWQPEAWQDSHRQQPSNAVFEPYSRYASDFQVLTPPIMS